MKTPVIRFEKQGIDRYAVVYQNTYLESDSKILIENSIRLHAKRPDENLQTVQFKNRTFSTFYQ